MIETTKTPSKPAREKSLTSQNADAWRTFSPGNWQQQIDVRDFILANVEPYSGDEGFLADTTKCTDQLWAKVCQLLQAERDAGGVLDADTKVCGQINSHPAGYIDQKLEKIVGLQTDQPLKRALLPYGGLRLAQQALSARGREFDPSIAEFFETHRKTHNDGVFDAYTPDILAARRSGIITGLPDGYGRGRIIGDYRRVALYGVDRLVADKQQQLAQIEDDPFSEEWVRQREEINEQIRALKDLLKMAATYGCDLSKPAINGHQAVQWTYLAYLAAAKSQNGAATSFGRTSTFFDIYFQRDLREGSINETEIQEIIDHLVIKMRLIRFLRTPDYDELFSGDPTWVTESIGGISEDGLPLVTKTSFRILQSLRNLGPAPEPNLTILWSKHLPNKFKLFCTKISIQTSSLQYENDDLMRPYWGDDYGIACCVSAMRLGKQMQFFGARVNLAKALLYAINGGRDEISGALVIPGLKPITAEILTFEQLEQSLDKVLDWLAKVYLKALNIIHYMHDKYAPEHLMFALHDREIHRTLACGVAGLSVTADSLSAAKYARVKMLRNHDGLVTNFATEGDFPCFGNNDERVDQLARQLVSSFMDKIKQQPTYRKAVPTQSILTITSNVVYGKKTGNTPDGRAAGAPFAPGANPMHGRDSKGAIAALCSVAKLPYEHCLDGISNTFSIIPEALGRNQAEAAANLVQVIDGYFAQNAQHLNVNVLKRETLIDAMEHPDQYPQLTVRVSGYAVNFTKLTREQQLDLIKRTFHHQF